MEEERKIQLHNKTWRNWAASRLSEYSKQYILPLQIMANHLIIKLLQSIQKSFWVTCQRQRYLISVLDVERLSRGGHVSHNALIPLQSDAAAGWFFQRGPLGHVKQAADQELCVRAVFAHLKPQTKGPAMPPCCVFRHNEVQKPQIKVNLVIRTQPCHKSSRNILISCPTPAYNFPPQPRLI